LVEFQAWAAILLASNQKNQNQIKKT